MLCVAEFSLVDAEIHTAQGVYRFRSAAGERDGTVVLQGSSVAYAFLLETLPMLEEAGIDLDVYYVASAELFDAQPDDVKAALARLKPEVALYVGGMGHRSKNFHKDMMTRRGFGDAANRIQELYLAGRKQEATDAVPDEWVDEKSLVGSPDRIKERFKRWAALEMVDSVYIRTTQDAAVDLMAEAAGLAPAR